MRMAIPRTHAPAPHPPGSPPHRKVQGKTAALALSALGVVYGDIGTSPLYAVRECFNGAHAVALNDVNLFGVASLVFWSLTTVVSVKYVGFILKGRQPAGEGGIFALLGFDPGLPTPMTPRLRSAAAWRLFSARRCSTATALSLLSISVLSAIRRAEVRHRARQTIRRSLDLHRDYRSFCRSESGTSEHRQKCSDPSWWSGS